MLLQSSQGVQLLLDNVAKRHKASTVIHKELKRKSHLLFPKWSNIATLRPVILMKCVLLSKQSLGGLNCIRFLLQSVALSTAAWLDPARIKLQMQSCWLAQGDGEDGAQSVNCMKVRRGGCHLEPLLHKLIRFYAVDN